MARKTTKSKSTKKQKTTPVVANITAAGNQSLNYIGEISIKINHGNKTISTKKYTNSGMPYLFKFLCLALAGNYTESLRPCQIKLFYYDKATLTSDYESSPANFNWITACDENSLVSSSAFIPYSSSPTLKKVTKADGKDNYEITYHFRIPFSVIAESVIHAVGLFPNSAIVNNEKNDVSAYYLFTKKDDSNVVWDPLELPNNTGNYSIILDWTMTIMNKPTN